MSINYYYSILLKRKSNINNIIIVVVHLYSPADNKLFLNSF